MKKLLLLSLSIGLFYSGFSQTFREYYSVKWNNSKEVLRKNNITNECLYSYIFNKKGIKDSTRFLSFEFDSLGNITQTVRHDTYRDDTTKTNYQYNADHGIHRMFVIYSWARSKPLITEYGYDSAGNKEMIYTYNMDTTYMEIEKRVYNENRQLICSYDKRSGSDDFYLKDRLYYSEDTTFSKQEFYDSKGRLDYSYIEEFDKNANKKMFYREDKKGKKLQGELFFDSTKRCIKQNTKMIEKYAEGIFSIGSATIIHPGTEEYSYNQDGTIFESVTRFDNSKNSTIIRHYYQKN